jgi:hypothetical protein
MEINVLFNVFKMMIVQVRIHVIRQQVRKFVHRVGMELLVLVEIHLIFNLFVHQQVK